jgi:hypothetical protein
MTCLDLLFFVFFSGHAFASQPYVQYAMQRLLYQRDIKVQKSAK